MSETSRQRIDSFKDLKDGWLWGAGDAPAHDGLDWLSDWIEAQEADGLPLAYLYPTGFGGVQLAWDTDAESSNVEVEVDLWHKTGSCLGPGDYELDFDMTDQAAVAAWRTALDSMNITGRDTLADHALYAAEAVKPQPNAGGK